MTTNSDRKRLENQLNANNVLSDRLRETRQAFRNREQQLLDLIRNLQKEKGAILSELLVLKSQMLELGIEPAEQESEGA